MEAKPRRGCGVHGDVWLSLGIRVSNFRVHERTPMKLRLLDAADASSVDTQRRPAELWKTVLHVFRQNGAVYEGRR